MWFLLVTEVPKVLTVIRAVQATDIRGDGKVGVRGCTRMRSKSNVAAQVQPVKKFAITFKIS